MLTNHHVVKPLSAAKETILDLDRYGYGSTHPQFETLMQYPALNDHKATKATIESLIFEQGDGVKKIQETLQRFEMKGQEPSGKQLARLNMIEKGLEELKKQKNNHRQAPHDTE